MLQMEDIMNYSWLIGRNILLTTIVVQALTIYAQEEECCQWDDVVAILSKQLEPKPCSSKSGCEIYSYAYDGYRLNVAVSAVRSIWLRVDRNEIPLKIATNESRKAKKLWRQIRKKLLSCPATYCACARYMHGVERDFAFAASLCAEAFKCGYGSQETQKYFASSLKYVAKNSKMYGDIALKAYSTHGAFILKYSDDQTAGWIDVEATRKIQKLWEEGKIDIIPTLDLSKESNLPVWYMELQQILFLNYVRHLHEVHLQSLKESKRRKMLEKHRAGVEAKMMHRERVWKRQDIPKIQSEIHNHGVSYKAIAMALLLARKMVPIHPDEDGVKKRSELIDAVLEGAGPSAEVDELRLLMVVASGAAAKTPTNNGDPENVKEPGSEKQETIISLRNWIGNSAGKRELSDFFREVRRAIRSVEQTAEAEQVKKVEWSESEAKKLLCDALP